MRTRWTKEEMESVLIQLNSQLYPFKKYRFSKDENGIVILGSGGYANVYEMECIDKPKEKFAVKVLGFGEKHVDSEEFRKSVQVQKDLAAFQNDVVKIIDYVEFRVFIDASCQICAVEKVSEFDDKIPEGDFLNLQFILMEKLVPVLSMDKSGKPKLYPEALASFEEDEIMKLAHNIGTALARAHEKKLLHRDIKLENVFYDPKKKLYKLGDFGIAKMTEDGMASTVAFTKGYGAPEVVGAVDERYDNTADIYSFGIMLYLLLNELKFPDSENYNVNVALQYSKGYQFPYPEHEDYELCNVLGGMCQYDPDERYQSMEKALNDIEGIMIGDDIRFKKENIKSAYVVGMVCYIVGMIIWKLTHMPEFALDIGFWGYVFLIAGGYEYWLNLKKKEHNFLSFAILCVGIYLLISTGFSWWKLLLVFGVSFSTGSFSGLVFLGVFIVDILARIMTHYPQMYESMQEYKWLPIFFLSFSGILFLQCIVLKERDVKTNSMYFKKNIYWIVVLVLYGLILINGLQFKYMGMQNLFNFAMLDVWYKFASTYDLISLGLSGVGLSAGWMIREKVLKRIEG